MLQRPWSRAVVLCSVGCFAGGILAADDIPRQLAAIEVPAGLVVEVAAQPPLVKYPMLGAFDDAGRLFVCESAGLNLDAEQLREKLPNFVRMLEDTVGDGKFDKSTIFADKMTLPSGAVWHDGALYVASPPSIWRLEDTDDDGIADRREEIITGFKYRGHAGDIHGPYLGPDGRLYFVDGTMGHEIRDHSGHILSKGNAARVFSSRLDGSDLETYCGGGMANPVAVTFTEEGEMIGAATFFDYDSQDRIRHDASFHAVYGGVYPRKLALLRDEFQFTGPLLRPLTRFGMSAPSNLTTYRSDVLGAEYRGNVFISHFNTRGVTRSRLTRDGSTFRAVDEPFLVSTNPDFHPCDVIEDADGSLLVIDTGGWFKIGCPTSSLQPEVLGAIYRVRRRDQQAVPDPRGLRITWSAASSKLLKFLADDRVAVRDRAVDTLAKRGDVAVAALRTLLDTQSVLARRNAVWTLTRIGTAAALAAARSALDDADPSVRLVAGRCAATHRDTAAVEQLVRLFRDPEPAVRREAATALGRIGSVAAAPALLQAFEYADDRILEHAIIYALIELNDPQPIRAQLSNPSTRVRRAALVALDQMEKSELTREWITPLLQTDDVRLLEAVVDVVGRHPEWVEVVTGLLIEWLLDPEATVGRRERLYDAVYALRRQPTCQELMAELLSRPATPTQARMLLLDVMIDSGFREFPVVWQLPVLSHLRSSNILLAGKSLTAIAASRAGQFDDGLWKYIQDTTRPVALRVQASGILSRDGAALPQATFELLRSQCSQDAPFETRLEAARAIGHLQLSSAQRECVIGLVADAGPLELPLLLKPLADVWRDKSANTAPRLLAALQRSPGFASLRQEDLTLLFDNAPPEVSTAAEPLFQRLRQEYASSLRQVLRTTFNLVGGDPARGKEIFFGKRALCSACHRAGPEPGQGIGPDLRRIGEVRSQRDLLEAILAPSSSFARGFESKSVVTNSGRVISGVIRQETDDTITLWTSQREQVRIERSEVKEVRTSKVSIMPHGLERSLTPDELRHLLAYLSSLRP